MLLPSAGISLNYLKLCLSGFFPIILHCFIQQDKALPTQSRKGKKTQSIRNVHDHSNFFSQSAQAFIRYTACTLLPFRNTRNSQEIMEITCFLLLFYLTAEGMCLSNMTLYLKRIVLINCMVCGQKLTASSWLFKAMFLHANSIGNKQVSGKYFAYAY